MLNEELRDVGSLVITLMLLGTTIALTLRQEPVPEWLLAATTFAIGGYLGMQAKLSPPKGKEK